MKNAKFKKILAITALSCAAGASSNVFAANDTMMDLLKALRDNGTIDSATYGILVNSAKADEEKSSHETKKVAEAVSKEAVATAGTGSGNWSDKVKVSGDVRLRYQNQTEDGRVSRDRGRYRYRLGITGEVNEMFQVGGGIASGGTDPRSTNETFDDQFETKDARIDYAYVQFKPNDVFTAIAGKFKRKAFLWAPTDLIWDGDINPEGLATNFNIKNGMGNAFVNAGVWVLDEFGGSKDDPFMVYGQLGQKFTSGNVFGTAAISYYGFEEVDGSSALGEHSAGSNTLVGGALTSSYDNLVLSGEMGVAKAFANRYMLAGFFDYVENTDISREDTGFAVGFKFGDKKVKEPGTWQAKYIYADLEQDAVLDFLPDSDRYNGQTGVKAHEVALKYQAWKNIQLGLDYYSSEDELANTDQRVLQADLLVKF